MVYSIGALLTIDCRFDSLIFSGAFMILLRVESVRGNCFSLKIFMPPHFIYTFSVNILQFCISSFVASFALDLSIVITVSSWSAKRNADYIITSLISLRSHFSLCLSKLACFYELLCIFSIQRIFILLKFHHPTFYSRRFF